MYIPRTPVVLPSADVLNAWVLAGLKEYTGCDDFAYHPAADAPDNYADLVEWSKGHKLGVDSLPVYDGGSDATIFGSAQGNYAFRAWHDVIHIQAKLGFTKADELKVADIHCATLEWHGAPYDVVKAIEADVKGQVLYYFKHKKFVNDQLAFVAACLERGFAQVVESGKKF